MQTSFKHSRIQGHITLVWPLLQLSKASHEIVIHINCINIAIRNTTSLFFQFQGEQQPPIQVAKLLNHILMASSLQTLQPALVSCNQLFFSQTTIATSYPKSSGATAHVHLTLAAYITERLMGQFSQSKLKKNYT